MSFNISFLEEHSINEPIQVGQIQIGSFSEQFESPSEFWQKSVYESQWYQGIRRVVEQREDSCLITSLTDPNTANFLFWWPIYVLDNTHVVLQNQVLFLNECENEFDVNNPYRSLRQRETTSEEGERISEWRISIKDLDVWLSIQGKQLRS